MVVKFRRIKKNNMKLIKDLASERRKKTRFPIARELRYKLMDEETIVESGMGTTVDMGSGGVAFRTDHRLQPGSFIELSISWPVLLEGSCPMRLIVFGRVLRSSSMYAACTIDKYEFRTQARTPVTVVAQRSDSMLQRWAGTVRREAVKAAAAAAAF